MPHLKTPSALALAGLVGELTFEAYAWLISPILFGVALQPANLVIALTNKLTGITLPYGMAFAVHVLIGVIGFSSAVWGVKKTFGLGFVAAGVLTGISLWFVAQGILAPLVGRSFMMGFGAYTQSSFIAHTGVTLVIAWVWQKLASHTAADAPSTESRRPH